MTSRPAAFAALNSCQAFWYAFARVNASRMTYSTPCRVAGYRRGEGWFAPGRFGFSPSANLMPGMAPSNSRSWPFFTPQRSLMVTLLPPMGFALPCRMLATVRPPARSRWIAMSVGSSTSPIPVIELTVVAPSLMASLAICECASMMPGDTNLPAASTSVAPAGTCTLGPIAAILPSRSTMVPLLMVPRVTVTSVALRIATTPAVCACAPGRATSTERKGRTTATSAAAATRITRRCRRTTEASSGKSASWDATLTYEGPNGQRS
jgi:hypothetical protein